MPTTRSERQAADVMQRAHAHCDLGHGLAAAACYLQAAALARRLVHVEPARAGTHRLIASLRRDWATASATTATTRRYTP